LPDRDRGGLRWVAEPNCTLDPEQHGWREVWVVVPLEPGTSGKRGRHRDPEGRALSYGYFYTENEALNYAATLTARSIECRVLRSLIGNERHYSKIVDPDSVA
jgi:hypothetical protein